MDQRHIYQIVIVLYKLYIKMRNNNDALFVAAEVYEVYYSVLF